MLGAILSLLLPPLLAYLADQISWWRYFFSEYIADHLQPFMSYGSVLMALFISSISISFLILHILKLNSKPFFKYGVYWDYKGNGYCPVCKKPTSQLDWVEYNDMQWKGLKCTCTVEPFVFMDKGQPMKGEEVMKLMSK